MKYSLLTLVILFTSICLQAQDKEANQSSTENTTEEIYTLEFEAVYMVYDQKGGLVLEGKGNKIDMSSLDKGTYFIKYDGKKDVFIKKTNGTAPIKEPIKPAQTKTKKTKK